jgi:RES domain-containing protein
MDVWRICRSKHEATAFSGDGAEKAGGRWNQKGYPMVYASENLSLAALELFVHISPGIIPDDLISLQGRFPAKVSVTKFAETDLPKNWRRYPAPLRLKTLGTKWLRDGKTLLLVVPSAINPVEKNILLNPAHPEMKLLKIVSRQSFQFDPRMFGK